MPVLFFADSKSLLRVCIVGLIFKGEQCEITGTFGWHARDFWSWSRH